MDTARDFSLFLLTIFLLILMIGLALVLIFWIGDMLFGIEWTRRTAVVVTG